MSKQHLFYNPNFPTGLILLLACLMQFNLHAEPPPDPPLIASAPDPCAWIIDVQHKTPRPALPTDPGQAGNFKRLMDVYPLLVRETMEKSGKDWHREKFYENQKTDNIWVCKGLVAFQFKHFPADKVTVMSVGDTISPAKSGPGPDFPELGWLDRKFFVGTVIYNGQKCYLYRDKNAKALTGTDELAPVSGITGTSAWIDVKTRLPIAVEDDNLLKTYTYRAGPAEIQPAGIFAAALNRALVRQNGDFLSSPH